MRQFQVLATCTHCRVESAVVETFDDAESCCHLGVATHSRCRMCGRETEGGTQPACEVAHALVDEKCPSCMSPITDATRTNFRCETCDLASFATVTAHPKDLTTQAEVHTSLQTWANEEAMSLTEFLDTSFSEGSVSAIHAKIVVGEVVTTSFDVLGFLFSHLGGGMSGTQGGAKTPPTQEEPSKVVTPQLTTPPSRRISLPDMPVRHQRSKVLPLVSVMAADGRLLAKERAFIDRFLVDEGMAPLEDHELRVHRPQEVGSVGSDEEHDTLLSMMFQLAYIDREGDSSELNIIRAFAHRWGISAERLAQLEQEYKPMGWDRFLIKMKSILLG